MGEEWKEQHKKAWSLLKLGLAVLVVGIIVLPTIWASKSAPEVLAANAQNMDSVGTREGDDEALAEEMPEETVEETDIREPGDYLIVLDPGHGGEDQGCGRDDIWESEIDLQIAKATEEKLLELGYQVMLTRAADERTEGENVSAEGRVTLANEAGADLFLSIHQSMYQEESTDISGIEVYYDEGKADDGSERLAKVLRKMVMSHTGAQDGMVTPDNALYVLRETQMPSCLIKTGYLSNPEERALLASEEYQAQIASGIASAIDLYFFPKTMYLTFDDGPSAENTMAVLDILKECNVKATFFVVGENVEKHPEVAKRIVEDGHTIAIHCYRHDYKKLYRSVDAYIEDFEKAWDVVYETTGVEVTMFRFPGGSVNAYNKKVYREIIEEMTDRGYVYFDWNASLEDATAHSSPEKSLRNARESVLERKRVILLAHDVIYSTTQCLEDIIGEFPEYQMLPLSEDVEPIHF